MPAQLVMDALLMAIFRRGRPQAVQAADARLYAAKEAGRNNVQPAPVPVRNN